MLISRHYRLPSAQRDPKRESLVLKGFRGRWLQSTAIVAAAAALTVGYAEPALAQSVWGGAGATTITTDYNTGTNWSTNPTAPVLAGSSAQFGDGTGGAGGTASTAVNVSAPVTTDSWTFLAASQSYTVTGSAVTFSNGATLTNNASAGQAISIANNMTGVNLSQAAASTLTISGTNSFTQTLISAGTLINNGSLTSTVGNSGTFTNNLTVTGAVNNAGIFNNNALGTVSGLLTSNGGTTNNAGQLNGGVNVVGGTVNNSNIVTGGVTLTGGTFNMTAGSVTGTTTNNGGTVTNNGGTFAAVTNTTGTFNNNSGNAGAVSNAATATNGGTIASLSNTGGTFGNTGIVTGASTVSGGAVTNTGAFQSTLGVTAGSFTNNVGGSVAGTTTNNGGTVINNGGTFAAVTNTTGTFNNNSGNAGAVSNAATATNGGTIASLSNTGGTFGNTGIVTGASTVSGGAVTNTGAFQSTLGVTAGSFTNNVGGSVAGTTTNNGGTVTNNGGSFAGVTNTTGTFTNTAGTVAGPVMNNATFNASGGTVNGPINNAAGGIFTVTGAVGTTGTFNNSAASSFLHVTNGGIYTVTGLVTNSGTAAGGGILVDFGGFLNATPGGITNNLGATIVNNGRIDDVLNNAGTVTNNLTYNADVATNTGTINNNATGTWTGGVTSNAGIINNSGIWNSNALNFNNSGGTLNMFAGSSINVTGAALVNTGTMNAFGNSTITGGAINNTGGTINLTGTAGTSNITAATSTFQGGTITTAINLNNGTAISNQIRVASASGAVTAAYTQVGGGATGFFPTLVSAGASTNSFTATGLHDVGLVHYQAAGPVSTFNPTNSSGVVGLPIVGPAIAPLTSILATIGSIDASFHQPGGNLVASPQTDKTGLMVGGPWVRVSGGVTNVFSTGTASFLGTPLPEVVQSKVRVQFAGVQAGADTGWLNLGGNGVNAHFGITGGNVSAHATEMIAASNQVNFEVPFIGAYYLITKGAFSTDFTYRHSLYEMSVTNPTASLFDARFNGRSDNVNGSVSYNIALKNNWFIEPTANVSYTRSTFDMLPVSNGAAVLGINQVESLLGRAGARVGTAFSYGGYSWSPFVLGLVQHEFKNNATGTFTATGSTPFDLMTNRVGTFYQTSLGLAFQSQTNGLLGFVRGDLRFGDRLNGGALLAGLRYTFGPWSANGSTTR